MTTMTTQPEKSDTSVQRKAMIDSQLRTSGVNEEFALARMMAVRREDFLPDDKAPLAYIDRAVDLGDAGHLASPLFYGKLLIEADPDSDDRVLLVEGGTGYLKALVSPLVGEIDTVSASDAAAGKLPSGKTYSLILVDGAIEHVPAAMANVLEDNGRIVGGLLLRQVTRLASGRKVAGHTAFQPVEDIGIPVLHQFDKPKGWSF